MKSVEGKLPPELERAAERKEREYARAAERGDLWGTGAAQAIALKCLPELAEGLEAALRDGETQRVVEEFLEVIRAPVSDPHSAAKLPSERLALCILHGALQSIGKNETYTDTAAAIGRNIYTECLFAKLLASRVFVNHLCSPKYYVRKSRIIRRPARLSYCCGEEACAKSTC
jgi:hypothetical protein